MRLACLSSDWGWHSWGFYYVAGGSGWKLNHKWGFSAAGSDGSLVNAVDFVGYSAGELEWIARLYNVSVRGQVGAFG